MKILHIIPTYLPANLASGPIQPIHSLNRELVNQGIEVTVYTSNFDGEKVLDVPIEKEVVVDGVKVFYFPLTLKSWYYSFLLHKTLKKNIKNFDLVHISSMFLATLNLPAYYARKFSVPYIVSTHGILMKKPLESKSLKKKLYLFLIDKKNLTGAQAIHFTTEVEKEEYIEARFPLRRGIVLPHGILAEPENLPSGKGSFRKKFNISISKKIVLFLGRLNWVKGFDILLPAFAEVLKRENEAILVIAGPDGGYKSKIDELIKSLNLEEKVLYTGMLDGEIKSSAFQESNVFVLTSYSENFSVVTAEAMNFGLPVVVTKGVGISSLIEKYGAGISAEIDVEEVSTALLSILKDQDLGGKMGENGKKMVKIEFDPQNVASKMLEEYREIIKNYSFSKIK